jgi:hypothetical protein
VIRYTVGRLADGIFRKRMSEFGAESIPNRAEEFVDALNPSLKKYEPAFHGSLVQLAKDNKLEGLRNEYALWAAENSFVPNGKTDRPYWHVKMKAAAHGNPVAQFAEQMMLRYSRFITHRGHQATRLMADSPGRSAMRVGLSFAIASALVYGASRATGSAREDEELERALSQTAHWSIPYSILDFYNFLGHSESEKFQKDPIHAANPLINITDRTMDLFERPDRMYNIYGIAPRVKKDQD